MNMPPHDVHLNDNVSDQLVPASGVFIAAAGAAFRKVLFSEEVRGGHGLRRVARLGGRF
jgi:hypothetical protein